MSYSQPCQDAKPVCFESFYSFFTIFSENINVRVKSLEDLISLDKNSFLDLLTSWFYYKDFPQNEPCNFTSSLFANDSMNKLTLGIRIAELRFIIQKINSLSANPKADPRVIEYSKKLMELAVQDHEVCLFMERSCDCDSAIYQLRTLEAKSKKILPYRSAIYLSKIQKIKEALALSRTRNVSIGEVYKKRFNEWVKSFSDDSLQTKIPDKFVDYFTKDEKLNLKKLDSDVEYFYEKMSALVSNTALSQTVSSNELLKVVNNFSQNQLSENIGILDRILKKINDPNLTGFSVTDILSLNNIFNRFLRYHEARLSDDPKEKELLLQYIYNNFFEKEDFKNLWYDPEKKAPLESISNSIYFEMLDKYDSYLLLTLKYLGKVGLRKNLLIEGTNLNRISSFFALRSSYDRGTFIHRINVLNSLIKKIDTFEEITPESKDYLKKLFNLFLLNHKAIMCLGEKKPEKAIKYLYELKEKSKGIFLRYSRDGGIADKLIETCQSQISKNKTEDEQDHSVSKMVRPSESEVD